MAWKKIFFFLVLFIFTLAEPNREFSYSETGQYVSICMAYFHKLQTRHYFPEKRDDIFLLSKVNYEDYRIGKFSMVGITPASVLERSSVKFKVSSITDVTQFERVWTVEEFTNTSQHLENILKATDGLINDMSKGLPSFQSTFVPNLRIVELNAMFLDAILHPLHQKVISLYYFKGNSESGRFQELLAKNQHDGSYKIPPVFPVIEDLIRRRTHSFFATTSFMIVLNSFQMEVEVDKLPSKLAYVSQIIHGTIIFIEAKLSAISTADLYFDQTHFIDLFKDGIEDKDPSSFLVNYPNAVIEGNIWCTEIQNQTLVRVAQELDLKISISKSISPYVSIFFPIQNVTLFFQWIQIWSSQVGLTKDIGPVGVTVSQFHKPEDTKPKAVPFNPTYCATRDLPSPQMVLMMSKITFISIGFFLGASIVGIYLLISYTYYLMTLSLRPGVSPNFLRVHVIPFHLYFISLRVDPTHPHEE